MSVLEKIRNKSGLAIVVVGGALALFVISDALQSNSRMFGANDTNVGEIDGESISVKQFEQEYQKALESYKLRSQQPNVDQNTSDMIREQTWNQMIMDGLMTKQYDELGINVTNEELFELVQGAEPHPQIKSAPIFQDPQTGQYDRNLVVRFLKNMTESNDEQAKTSWLEFETGLVKETASKKYNTLFKKGVYATSLEAKAVYNNRNHTTDMDLVAVNYFSIPDSTIAAEDGELKSYFSKNKDKYKEKTNSRKLEFVTFEVVPTAEDTATIQKWVTDQMTQFAAATNDTLYVDVNSDSKFDTVSHPLSFFPPDVQNAIFTLPVGGMVGPVFADGKYKIYKVAGIKEDSLYQMRASHILFKIENNDTAATMKKAQEVLAEIRKGADFGEKAAQYGTDGTASRGGDLGWFAEGAMVKEFNDYVKRGNKDDIGVLKTQFGIHIVKVTENKSKKTVAAGVLERAIEPSERTVNTAYNQASQFAAASVGGAEAFENAVKEKGLSKRVADNLKENDKSLAGLPDAREAIRWAYNAEIGDVSEVFSMGNLYLVATLSQIKEKDNATFEDVKDRVTADYRKDKKAEQLIEKVKTAMSGAGTLQDIATKLQVAVTPVVGQTFENPNVAYVGPDNTFIGTIFGTKTTGKIVGPIKGDNAIFVANIIRFSDGPQVPDYAPYKAEIISQLSQRVEYGSFEVLKEMKNVKDNRYKFY
ncbi:MAG: SurA N-terminal domain-containing protein [Bacteroidota bacterium]